MNSVSLALDCFVVGKDVSALSDLTKPTLGQIIKLGGRTLAVDALTYGASYGTTAVLEDTNLPNELKLLLSLGVGLTVSHVSGKYLIKSADGNVISEVDEKTLKGVGGVDIPKATDLTMTETVSNHSTDIIKKGVNAGELSRPYVDSNGTNLLIQEIMDSGVPVKDVSLPNGLRWDVSGSFNGRDQGVWELVIDLDTNRIVHFNFTK